MTKQENKDITPDGKWKVVFDPDSGIRWVQLTQSREQFTIEEIVVMVKKSNFLMGGEYYGKSLQINFLAKPLLYHLLTYL